MFKKNARDKNLNSRQKRLNGCSIPTENDRKLISRHILMKLSHFMYKEDVWVMQSFKNESYS